MYGKIIYILYNYDKNFYSFIKMLTEFGTCAISFELYMVLPKVGNQKTTIINKVRATEQINVSIMSKKHIWEDFKQHAFLLTSKW